jgi:hypothetical protein
MFTCYQVTNVVVPRPQIHEIHMCVIQHRSNLCLAFVDNSFWTEGSQGPLKGNEWPDVDPLYDQWYPLRPRAVRKHFNRLWLILTSNCFPGRISVGLFPARTLPPEENKRRQGASPLFRYPGSSWHDPCKSATSYTLHSRFDPAGRNLMSAQITSGDPYLNLSGHPHIIVGSLSL